MKNNHENSLEIAHFFEERKEFYTQEDEEKLASFLERQCDAKLSKLLHFIQKRDANRWLISISNGVVTLEHFDDGYACYHDALTSGLSTWNISSDDIDDIVEQALLIFPD